MRNSVLIRIEVKSELRKKEFREFKKSCDEYRKLGLDLDDERIRENRISIMEINMLFAYKSDVNKDTILSWFSPVTDGSISAVCVLDRGFWRRNKKDGWDEYCCKTKNIEAERLAAFVGFLSNTAFDQHISAQGRDRLSSLESGVGQHFNNWAPIS